MTSDAIGYNRSVVSWVVVCLCLTSHQQLRSYGSIVSLVVVCLCLTSRQQLRSYDSIVSLVVVCFAFNIPPTAKVIWLKSKLGGGVFCAERPANS